MGIPILSVKHRHCPWILKRESAWNWAAGHGAHRFQYTPRAHLKGQNKIAPNPRLTWSALLKGRGMLACLVRAMSGCAIDCGERKATCDSTNDCLVFFDSFSRTNFR